MSNRPGGPGFLSNIGYPGGQEKIADYIDLRSDATGTSVAYTATFNGEQDVWFVPLFPDCNENTILDDVDIATGTGLDEDGNGIPDDCTPLLFIGAGSVPDGATVPGLPLTLTPTGPGALTLEWGPGCGPTDADYAVCEGVLGDLTSHTPKFCTTGGLTTTIVSAPVGNAYYLVVPLSLTDGYEGSYGLDSSGAERPPGVFICMPQQVLACP